MLINQKSFDAKTFYMIFRIVELIGKLFFNSLSIFVRFNSQTLGHR